MKFYTAHLVRSAFIKSLGRTPSKEHSSCVSSKMCARILSLRAPRHSCWRRLRLCCVPETGSDSANPGSPHSGWPPMTTCTISSPAKTAPTIQRNIEQGSTVFLVLCSSCPSTSLSSFSTTSIRVHSLTQQRYTNISEKFCEVPFVIGVDSLSEDVILKQSTK